MMSIKSTGSQITLVYQVKFLTFTPDQFNQVLKEKGFTMTPSQVTNPLGQIAQIQLFSKGNLVVFFAQNPQNPTQTQIIFQALNTVSLTSALSGGTSPNQNIMDILMGLNIVEDVVSQVAFNCTTRVAVELDPTKILTSGIRPALLEKITKALGSSLNVTSLRLGTAHPLQKGMQLTLEPLVSNPTKELFVNVVFQTSDMAEFNEFIRGFGEDAIRSTIEAITSV